MSRICPPYPEPEDQVASETRRLVILDRDGVINFESPDFIREPNDWVPIPGSLEAIATLCRHGFSVVVATNQSGVGRGLISPEALAEIHAKMTREIEAAGGALAGIFFCPHLPEAGCDCRKPRPGLFLQISKALGVRLAGLPMVGDSLRDIEAARAVGGRPILVRTGNGSATEELLPAQPETEVFDDLRAAVAGLMEVRSSPA
jgi:D-glycero-D-manno-heptose 1,7-bisphosphate phosphatase